MLKRGIFAWLSTEPPWFGLRNWSFTPLGDLVINPGLTGQVTPIALGAKVEEDKADSSDDRGVPKEGPIPMAGDSSQS